MQQDQRRSKRFELRLPFELVQADSSPALRTGETHNLSSGGVLFSTGSQIEVGEAIEYMITLPSAAESGTSVRIRCKGKVIRLERRDNGSPSPAPFTAAATLERYEFVRDHAQSTPLP